MRRRFRPASGRCRLAAFAASGLVSAMVLLLAIPGVAESAVTAGTAGGASVGNDQQARVVGPLSLPIGGGTHYLYVEDGTTSNGIDVFSVVDKKLTHIQSVSVGTAPSSLIQGAHYLAIATAGDCLVLSSPDDGTVYSFVINGDGTLGQTPASSVYVSGEPGDLAIIGSTVVESNVPGLTSPSLDTLSIGTGCTLTLERRTPTGDWNYNIATIGSHVFSDNGRTGNLLRYKLGSGGKLTQVNSTPGQLVHPYGAAIWRGKGFTNFYTGTSDDTPMTQGDSVTKNGFTPLSGSPATNNDPKAESGAGVAVSAHNKLLVQLNWATGTISWYTLTQTSMSYGGDTYDAQRSPGPLSLTIFGNLLLAPDAANGTVEECALSSDIGVWGCQVIVTVPSKYGGTSVAIK